MEVDGESRHSQDTEDGRRVEEDAIETGAEGGGGEGEERRGYLWEAAGAVRVRVGAAVGAKRCRRQRQCNVGMGDGSALPVTP